MMNVVFKIFKLGQLIIQKLVFGNKVICEKRKRTLAQHMMKKKHEGKRR